MVDVALERIGDKRPVYLAVLHANARQDAEKVLELILSKIECRMSLITDVSPTIGTHTGPGTIGIAYMAGYDYP
jgi:fatty acid-binding protein DegV